MLNVQTGDCSKFREADPKDLDWKKALLFIKLINNSCPKQEALKFCNKRICKYDSSRQFDGPTKHRLIKNAATNRGWCAPQFIQYNLGKDYQRPKTEEDEVFEKFAQKNRDRIDREQKKQIDYMNNFIEDINSKCNMTYNNLHELKDKVRHIRQEQEHYRNSPVEYFRYNGQRFMELHKEYITKQSESLVGFKSIFSQKKIQLKQKRNEDFFKRVKKQEPSNIQTKFIRLQSEQELLKNLHSEPNQLRVLNSLSSIRDTQQFAAEFNKAQYLFDESKPHVRTNKKKVSKIISIHLENAADEVITDSDYEEQFIKRQNFQKMLSQKYILGSPKNEVPQINLEGIKALQLKYEKIKNKEQKRINNTNTLKTTFSSTRRKTEC